MRKANTDELRPEYYLRDLGDGVRGKYLKQFKSGTNLVLLPPEIAVMFDDEESVNEALRTLIKLAQKSVGQKVR